MFSSKKIKVVTLTLAMAAVFSLGSISAAAADTAAPETTAAVSTAEQAAADYKDQVLKLVNAEREKAGVADLVAMDKLSAMANVRAQESATSFKHVRPDGDKWSTIFTDYSMKYVAAGENLAYGFKTPEAVVTAWMNSPTHKENLLDPDFKYIGIGYYANESGTIFCSQLFYTPRSK